MGIYPLNVYRMDTYIHRIKLEENAKPYTLS